MSVLVTGAAGFIGFHVSKLLLEKGETVVGIDNLNDYYDPRLKQDRLAQLSGFPEFHFLKIDVTNGSKILDLFGTHEFSCVVHLAAQAGVRFSIENPMAYIHSNVVGFQLILEACRLSGVEHLVYASSSSVYGNSSDVPFSTAQRVDNPVSTYAATKKSNELMAHVYSHLYGLPTTGLRFFTVYGPWGRPDMSPFIFTKAILSNEPIRLFNHGNHQPVELSKYVDLIESALGVKAIRTMAPAQPGDVHRTCADISDLIEDTGFSPSTSLEDGIEAFVSWYREYYQVGQR
jgi:UDP-glucuronate 4-epimerase